MSIAEADELAEATPERRQVEAATRESAAVATLHLLNAEYARALAQSDTAWYEKHLSADFVCTLTDGHRISRAEFIHRTREGSTARDVRCDEVDVRPMGEVALVLGVIHELRNGTLALTRYTMIWRSLHGRWRAVAAQFTEVGQN